ncbi:MAG: hypothetical protein RBU37_15805 [Myxococcota bacterium]|nr:hypothetical protein [Myxococcota bacterium]
MTEQKTNRTEQSAPHHRASSGGEHSAATLENAEAGGTGQAPNRQEVGGIGQASNQQEVDASSTTWGNRSSAQSTSSSIAPTASVEYSESGVDLTQIRFLLALSPSERLRYLTETVAKLNRMRAHVRRI